MQGWRAAGGLGGCSPPLAHKFLCTVGHVHSICDLRFVCENSLTLPTVGTLAALVPQNVFSVLLQLHILLNLDFVSLPSLRQLRQAENRSSDTTPPAVDDENDLSGNEC